MNQKSKVHQNIASPAMLNALLHTKAKTVSIKLATEAWALFAAAFHGALPEAFVHATPDKVHLCNTGLAMIRLTQVGNRGGRKVHSACSMHTGCIRAATVLAAFHAGGEGVTKGKLD